MCYSFLLMFADGESWGGGEGGKMGGIEVDEYAT